MRPAALVSPLRQHWWRPSRCRRAGRREEGEDAMRIRTLMTTPVETCGPASSLGEAAQAMRTSGCGCLPVVDAHERLVGMITDRDVCRVVALRRDPWDVPVSEVMARDVVSCRVGDDLDV